MSGMVVGPVGGSAGIRSPYGGGRVQPMDWAVGGQILAAGIRLWDSSTTARLNRRVLQSAQIARLAQVKQAGQVAKTQTAERTRAALVGANIGRNAGRHVGPVSGALATAATETQSRIDLLIQGDVFATRSAFFGAQVGVASAGFRGAVNAGGQAAGALMARKDIGGGSEMDFLKGILEGGN